MLNQLVDSVDLLAELMRQKTAEEVTLMAGSRRRELLVLRQALLLYPAYSVAHPVAPMCSLVLHSIQTPESGHWRRETLKGLPALRVTNSPQKHLLLSVVLPRRNCCWRGLP